MAYETLEMLIDGQWVQGSGGRIQAVVNPATEEAFAQVPLAEAADLDRAIEASTRAFKTWGKTTPFERQAIMEKAARLLEERKDAIAETLTRENGKPLAEAKAEIDVTIGFTRWFGEEAKRSYGRLIPARSPGARQMAVKEPVGPASAFVAWNFPGSNVIKKLSAAMAAGCTLIMKPAEETPGTAVALARAYHDAGLPAGVLNIVFGVPSDVSEHVLASPHIKKMSFTGSVPVGKHLARLAADNLIRTTMELGGHAPVVVFDDADIENALNSMHAFKFRNAGQVCISPTRFYVQQDVYNRFVEGFTERVNAMQVGNGLDANTNMGPLIAQRRLEVMEEFVADAKDHGATVATGGERIGNQGYFYAPTVLKDVPDDAKIMNDEPFGPLAPMTPFKSFDEVVERANSLPFGLASYAFTSDGNKASKLGAMLEAGMVGINHSAIAAPETPFGGVNDSGYGHEGGIEGIEAFQRTRFITEMDV